jgi:hypothetical protein
MAGADLFREKSTAGWLLVAGLFREKSTAGWWLISQANKLKYYSNCLTNLLLPVGDMQSSFLLCGQSNANYWAPMIGWNGWSSPQLFFLSHDVPFGFGQLGVTC